MKRKVVLVGVLALAVVAVGVVGQLLGWFTPDPSSVVKDSFAKANAGRYEEATQNLRTGDRKRFHENPELMKEVWDILTRNQTILSVYIGKEDRGPIGTFGDIHIVITYKDGTKARAKEKIGYSNGRWSHGISELYDAIAGKELKEKFALLTLSLAKEHTRVPGTGVALRLPEGSAWDPRIMAFEHPEHGILIEGDASPRASFPAVIAKVERYLARPNTRLLQRKEFIQNGVRSVLFEGEQLNEKRIPWRLMYLVIGEEAQADLVTALLPTQENFIKSVTECLTSVNWEK